jgi:plastocyanin
LGTLPHFFLYSLQRIGFSLLLTSLCILPTFHSSALLVRASVLTYSATIVDYAYQPPVINITTGTEVIWTYVSSGLDRHTVSSKPQTNVTQGGTPLISSGTLNPGQSFSYVFYKHGFYPIQCGFHPTMNGLVNVTGSDIQPPQLPVQTSLDYTLYVVIGGIAAIIGVISIAVLMKRRDRKQAALPSQSKS